MPARFLLLLSMTLLSYGCSGGDKHLPSSNPPEYDPKKVYTAPAAPPTAPATSVAKPAEPGPPPVQLPPLEPRPNEQGTWRKVPVRPESLQLFKDIKTPCEALSKVVEGLGSTQLFAGADGAVLKKSLGTEADAIARWLDEEVAESLKQSLGPTATHCTLPAKPRKIGKLYAPYQAPRIVLTHGSSNTSFLIAQATPSQVPDAAREFPPQVQEAPPEWVGKKTTRRTAGNYSSRVLVLGGKVRKCPSPEGEVPGDFEFAVVLDQTIADSSSVRTVHIGLHASATLKGQVSDDATIQYIDVDLSTVAERGGTEVPASVRRRHSQFRFVPSQGEIWPGFPTNITGLSEAGWDLEGATQQEDSFVSDAAAAIMLWGGQTYLDAQKEWRKPNTCVEITFEPATKTQSFAPSKSYQVKTELRTKKEQALVPTSFKEAKERPRERNGTVTPREDKSEPGRPATFTYQAPGTRVRHSGFFVGAVSRAGVAQAKQEEWELAPSAYVLEFKSHIVQEPLNLVSGFGMQMSSNGFDAHVQATVPLQHTEDRGWVGEGVMQYATRTKTQAAQCEIRIQGTGTTTFHVNGGSISSDPDPFSVNLTILPGRSGEVAETHCSSSNTPEKLKELFATQGVQGGEAHGVTEAGGWSSAFNVTRFRTFKWTPGMQGYEIGGWTPVRDSDVIAKNTITVNCSIGLQTCREETTLTLRLADEPNATASPPR